MISKIQERNRKKNSGLVSNFKFRVILGQISNFSQDREFIYQNDALDVNFSKKGVTRPTKIIRGQKFIKKVKF